MSRMLCKCGSTLGSSISPSPYGLSIYYEEEISDAIKENPKVELSDFLTGWDNVNEMQKDFMNRHEPVEYWYCPECHRVYEIQARVGGRWLRVYCRLKQVFSGKELEGSFAEEYAVRNGLGHIPAD